MILAVIFPQEVCTPALPNASPSLQRSGAFGGLPCFCSFSYRGFIFCTVCLSIDWVLSKLQICVESLIELVAHTLLSLWVDLSPQSSAQGAGAL